MKWVVLGWSLLFSIDTHRVSDFASLFECQASSLYASSSFHKSAFIYQPPCWDVTDIYHHRACWTRTASVFRIVNWSAQACNNIDNFIHFSQRVHTSPSSQLNCSKCMEGDSQWVPMSHQESRHISSTPALLLQYAQRPAYIFNSNQIERELGFCRDIEGASNYADPSPWQLTWAPFPPSLPRLTHAPLSLTLSLSLLHTRLLSFGKLNIHLFAHKCTFFVPALPIRLLTLKRLSKRGFASQAAWSGDISKHHAANATLHTDKLRRSGPRSGPCF